MKPIALSIVLVAAGCEASLGGFSDVDVDAGVVRDGGGRSDGSSSGNVDAAQPPACASGRKVYLNFDGVSLTQSATSNSTANQASWLGVNTATVPAWRANSGTRATDITTVTDGVRQRLTATPIDVVTARPASGTYVMIVFGGANTAVGTSYTFATSFHDCNDAVKNDVGWVSDMSSSSLSLVADIAVGAIGWGLGLDGTTSTAGCMCGWANGCSSAAGACTLSASIATSITNGVESACTAGTQNEVAAFSTGFCAP